MVRVPGADPGLPKRWLYRPGGVPPPTTRMGCLTGFEPANAGTTSRSLMPSGVRHKYPREVSNLRPPRCERGALPLSYTGVAAYPRAGLEPAPDRLIRTVP